MGKVFSCPYNVFPSRKSSRISKFSESFTVESVNGNGCKEIVSIHFFSAFDYSKSSLQFVNGD